METEETETTTPPLDWKYTMRREMQMIVPGIYLGPYQAATKPKLQTLLDVGITHILCVRQEAEAKYIRVNFPENFVYKVVEFRDHPCENIIKYFSEVKSFIDQCLNSGGKLLIHGNGGLCRSAALTIAYIMEKYDMTYRDAFDLVKSKRYCVFLNSGFHTQLLEYEPIYKANRMSASWPKQESADVLNAKRRLEPDDYNTILDFNYNL